MKVKEIILDSYNKLETNNIPFANQEAEDIVCFVIKKNKGFLYSNNDYNLSEQNVKKIKEYVNRRCLREPLAYIFKQQPFCSLNFYVNKNVLIPRGATETFVELITEYLITKKNKLNIVDVGTGSGCIIISLAHKFKNNHNFYATDISKKALHVATKNTKKYNLENIIKFTNGNLLEPFKKTKFDLIIANLPYLNTKEFDSSPTNKELEFEPFQALVDRDNGLYSIKKLIKNVSKNINKNGKIFLEIGHNQSKELEKYIKTIHPNSKIISKKDTCQFSRYLIIDI